jgi:hypothetical protein
MGRFLAGPLIAALLDRIRDINQRFGRLAARLQAGAYVPRRTGPRRQPPVRQPRRQNPLPQTYGWLLDLVPEAVGYRAQLDHLLRDPAMAALMASAPEPMARVLRPLCWMLRVTPPPALAKSRPADPPPKAAAPQRPPPSVSARPRPVRSHARPKPRHLPA